MKFSKFLSRMSTASIIASISIIGNLSLKIVKAEIPLQVLTYPGQPHVAIFAEKGESFALGCQSLAGVFKTPIVQVKTTSQWNSTLTKFPVVGDIHCDSRTRLYAPSGEPGAIVFKHRDGKYYRHYVSSPEFFSAIGGNPVPISASDFRNEFPNRGIDFHAK